MENLLQTKQIVLKDLLVNYYQVQTPHTPKTLVFLHGWRSEGAVWSQIMKVLGEQGYTSYALDLPGFGKSQPPKVSFNLNNYCDVVNEFINKLDLKNVVLIGHSFGGRITIKLSSKFLHERINSIVLVDSAGIYHTSIATKAKKIIAGIVKPVFKPSFMQPLRKKIYGMIGADDYLETTHLNKTFENIVGEDLTPLLDLIKIKTLIVWGREDDNEYTPLKDAMIMNSKIDGSQSVVIDNAKHFSFLDQKDKFIESLEKFLAL